MRLFSKTRRDFLKLVGTGAASWFVGGCTESHLTSTDKVNNKRPNVVLVMTDDQGYGDLSCTGNPIVKTPNIDTLYARSVRLADFHVSPTCSPTRASLLTGRYCNATGVWHTVMGRSLLREDEVTLGDCFRASGYRTAIFGKWHLGDNYPFRPQDRGFDEVLIHGGGAIGNTPDYFGNDYFDDTYFHGDQLERCTGYCTDVWFDHAMQFMKGCAGEDRPFFCYMPTNAAHGPYRVAEKYSQLYDSDTKRQIANFYGMITNIDENMGRLISFLKDNSLEDNTILIFMTDNGSAMRAFSAGMKGSKGSEYEGGHRVPCFIYWPAGGLVGPRDVNEVTAHIDILPTLLDLCDLKRPSGPAVHGASLRPLLYSGSGQWKKRAVVVDSQRMENLIKWRKCSVMQERWRLVNGKELYRLDTDPGQKNDIAADHPDVVERLRGEYETWWREISERGDEYVPIVLGHEAQNPTCLTSHDWHDAGTGYPVFDQSQVRRAVRSNGFWAVDVARAGRYEIELRRWQREVDQPISGSIPGSFGQAIKAVKAKLMVGGMEQTKAVESDDKAAVFSVTLKPGPARLQSWLVEEDGQSRGAYYVYVRRL
jgi:arylsulfatase A-like enzyme